MTKKIANILIWIMSSALVLNLLLLIAVLVSMSLGPWYM